MKKLLFISAIAATTVGCTSVDVTPLQSHYNPELICIEENPKVIVKDFVSVVRNRIEYHDIQTQMYRHRAPTECEFTMRYTALQNWDMATYLHHAELYLRYDGRTVAKAEYHLNGKGGLSMMKWQSTKTKMDPVVDELLGR